MKIIILLVLVAFELSSAKLNSLSDEFINYINNKQSTWKAGRNFDENTSMEDLKKLLGGKKHDPNYLAARRFVHPKDSDIPESFDSREQWPECKDVIGTIADQSHCGSCWAVAAASSMSDRRCIHSQGKLKIPVSAIDLISCGSYGGCDGDFAGTAWERWCNYGIVTGGLYNSSQGCKPYPFQQCEHHINGSKIQCSELDYYTPECKKECDDTSLIYENDLTFGTDGPYAFYGEDIQREIMKNGPVEATFDVYDDLYNYKSGVYQYQGGNFVGGHCVRIIGWGIENDTPYWLIANSWNEDWGDNGYFKILRGNSEAGIENEIIAALPKV